MQRATLAYHFRSPPDVCALILVPPPLLPSQLDKEFGNCAPREGAQLSAIVVVDGVQVHNVQTHPLLPSWWKGNGCRCAHRTASKQKVS